jgi:hypothetical protein
MGAKLDKISIKNNIKILCMVFLSLGLPAKDIKLDKPTLGLNSAGLIFEEKVKTYNIVANPSSINITSVEIKKPLLKSKTRYRLPTKRDRYVIKVLNKKGNVVSLVGIGDPFTIHADHIGYEDSEAFSTSLENQEIELILPAKIEAETLVFLYQNEFGLSTISSSKIPN